MRLIAPFLLLGAGCVIGPKAAPEGIPSAVRTGVAVAAWPCVEMKLRGLGFDAELVTSSRTDNAKADGVDAYYEEASTLAFNARRDGVPVVLTVAEAAAVLAGVKSDVRKLVTTAGGEVTDTAEGEAYQERTLVVAYRVDRVVGTLQFRLTPADGGAEPSNRLVVTARESPVP